MPPGTAVIDGRTYHITSIRLRRGMFLITAVHHGPVRACRAQATIFGEDGQGVCQSWDVEIPERAATADHVIIDLPIKITAMEIEQAGA